MKTIRKLHLIIFSILIGILPLTSMLNPGKASAVSGSQWNPADIIDDVVFFNPNSMSTTDIQNFLVSKVPVCDTYHASGYGFDPPFICLKDYTQTTPAMAADSYCGATTAGSKSAATIIKEVAVACGINPQVLLITLQKEQILVTDDWPLPTQYTKATGFGCPDSSLSIVDDSNQNGCYDDTEGFFKQIYYAARQFQLYAKKPSLYNYRAGQTSYVPYQANNPGCGGTNITMQNQATAGLYNYTPYQPNTAALNNLYGTGDACSAYGNRNFWRMFWDWFGNPIGPDYAWLIDSFSYSGGDNNLVKNQTETLTLKAKNVGRIPWYNHGDCPVRLGTWGSGRNSTFANNTWLSSSKITTVQESVVMPNTVGTFTFQVTPSQKGTFVEGLNLVAENCQWLPWPGLSPTINVTDPYSWSVQDVIYGNGTGIMDPGSNQLITVKVRNIGNVTWNKFGSAPVRLGTWQPDRPSAVDSGWLSPTRIDMNEATVAPGATGAFQFYVHMPASGLYYERFNLVAEGQTWLDDQGLTLFLEGKTFAWQPVWFSPSTGNWNIPRNTTFTITLKAKNTGTATWTKNGTFPIRLGTDPPGRGTALEHSSWINSIRPTGLVEDSVPPGAEGTFTFLAKTPDVPGMRYEAFNLVAEGILWFNNPGFAIYVNVL